MVFRKGYYSGSPTIKNCIIWGNIDDLDDDFIATYSCIEDGDSGTGNISSDPNFVDAAGDDYHLDSSSPCIDASDNTATTDTGYGTAPIVDMGADEYDPN